MLRTAFVAAALAASLSVPSGAQPPAASLDRLSWLAGCWSRTRHDGLTEEHWMKPSGGTMLGMGRSVTGGRTTEFEFLQITDVAGSLAYIAKPSGQPEATFPLKSLSDTEVVFENAIHDFPQRIIYRRQDNGTLAARIEGTMKGQARAVDYPFARCR